MTETILALDLGTQTGWALHQLDGTITSGTENFKPHRFEGGGMRFLRFKRWLGEVLAASDHINAVYFEEVRRHAGVDAAHAYRLPSGHGVATLESVAGDRRRSPRERFGNELDRQITASCESMTALAGWRERSTKQAVQHYLKISLP